MDWQPIEHLPDDRQFLLVAKTETPIRFGGHSFYTVGVWMESENGYMLQSSGYPYTLAQISKEFLAWCEVPEAPK